jgi:hypothetical protein
VRVRSVTATEIKPEEERLAIVIGGKGKEHLCNRIFTTGCRNTGGRRVLLSIERTRTNLDGLLMLMGNTCIHYFWSGLAETLSVLCNF